MKDRGLALKAEFNQLLAEHHLTEADVTPQYQCLACRDTGFVDGRMCTCLKSLQRRMAFEKLSMSVPLENCTFESFSLDYYKDDERAYRQMEKVFAACKSYGEKFRADSPSLLFKGGTGLGKTHLSLAIAGKAIEKGFGVIYGSAQSFAVALERERFDRDLPEDGSTDAQLGECDLLILDDLGTEFPSAYVNAALYNIVNTRMMAGKPTIISTNLSLKELEQRYFPAVRLPGDGLLWQAGIFGQRRAGAAAPAPGPAEKLLTKKALSKGAAPLFCGYFPVGSSFWGKRLASILAKGPERKQNRIKATSTSKAGSREVSPFWNTSPPEALPSGEASPSPPPGLELSPTAPATGTVSSVDSLSGEASVPPLEVSLSPSPRNGRRSRPHWSRCLCRRRRWKPPFRCGAP